VNRSAPRPRLALAYTAAHRRGGVERVVHDLLSAADIAKNDVHFVGSEFEPALDGITHTRVELDAGRRQSLRSTQSRIAAQLVKLAPDVAITAGADCPAGDVLLVGSVHRAWVAERESVTVHGVAVPGWLRAAHPWHRRMLRLERDYFSDARPAHVLACSTQVQQDITHWYGVDPARITVIPNGYSPSQFSFVQRRARREEVRRKIGATDDDRVLLLVANELHRKGLSILLHAVAQLGDARLRIDVVGKASLAPFASVIDRLGLRDRVHWHGPTSDIASFYAAADLLVLATSYEPFGLVVIEALAMGTPVIVSRLAGASSAIQPGVNGELLDDPRDAAELAGKIAAACGSDATLARWGAAAAASVEDYSWEVVARRIWSIVDDVATRGNGRFVEGTS
jgi:UDP-glucose:(heptosyl)LPS alpha-1,3-glucosyltransferase